MPGGGLTMCIAIATLLAGCAVKLPAANHEELRLRDGQMLAQLGKSDFDRIAELELREHAQSLRLLMTKLYKRNPRELAKSTSGTVEQMVDWVFEGSHGWRFQAIGYAQDVEAIHLAFREDYPGDRVLPFIVGLYTMLLKAHGGKNEFYLFDRLEPQRIYNAARNIEIAVWKLSHARNSDGQLYLLSNAMEEVQNLSFEREFGKMIGRTDLLALALAESTQRRISRVTQSLATAIFLPF